VRRIRRTKSGHALCNQRKFDSIDAHSIVDGFEIAEMRSTEIQSVAFRNINTFWDKRGDSRKIGRNRSRGSRRRARWYLSRDTSWNVRSYRNTVHSHVIHHMWAPRIENILRKKFQSLGSGSRRESQRNFRPDCRTLLISTCRRNYSFTSKSNIPSSLISIQ